MSSQIIKGRRSNFCSSQAWRDCVAWLVDEFMKGREGVVGSFLYPESHPPPSPLQTQTYTITRIITTTSTHISSNQGMSGGCKKVRARRKKRIRTERWQTSSRDGGPKESDDRGKKRGGRGRDRGAFKPFFLSSKVYTVAHRIKGNLVWLLDAKIRKWMRGSAKEMAEAGTQEILLKLQGLMFRCERTWRECGLLNDG